MKLKQWLLREATAPAGGPSTSSLSTVLIDEVTSNMLAATHPTGIHESGSRKAVDSLHPHFHR